MQPRLQASIAFSYTDQRKLEMVAALKLRQPGRNVNGKADLYSIGITGADEVDHPAASSTDRKISGRSLCKGMPSAS